jgi:hypothetical protein
MAPRPPRRLGTPRRSRGAPRSRVKGGPRHGPQTPQSSGPGHPDGAVVPLDSRGAIRRCARRIIGARGAGPLWRGGIREEGGQRLQCGDAGWSATSTTRTTPRRPIRGPARAGRAACNRPDEFHDLLARSEQDRRRRVLDGRGRNSSPARRSCCPTASRRRSPPRPGATTRPPSARSRSSTSTGLRPLRSLRGARLRRGHAGDGRVVPGAPARPGRVSSTAVVVFAKARGQGP